MPIAQEPRFVVVTGRSGAGRSVVADHLEDLGWRVVRNLPAELLPGLVDVTRPGDRTALVLGPGQEEQAGPTAELLRSSGAAVHVLFLTAEPETLVRRYNETRRVHPLAGDGTHLLPVIEREARRLGPVREVADIVVDSTNLSKHDLRRRIAAMLGPQDGAGSATAHITIVSFGFKHGLPLDADLVLDCRFLPNPHWVERLRPGTGLDAAVRDHVLGQPAAPRFLDRVEDLLVDLLPAFAAENRTVHTVAVGCTGGRHRSVAVAEAAAERLRRRGVSVAVLHRDVRR
ncbi:RNase adapter RapZ [Paractinoplanes brasiliensis]|uniref:UPF0042 nucleotide-binding protein n=1 Tax=Paractinoplanes brasiliensis TaxID=52695 RepID=A0A4R6JZ62_9ACTN|nr:RNase adapter RapZ [Actinoplanes brasiliensis]TDO42079.1 UPF0042 nucleotide-binding protein [Actinoplanes brasiliensis]GID33046.1 nucleotide-binding protein Cgl1591/cg1794 [Actinoplanes brasiliensis]